VTNKKLSEAFPAWRAATAVPAASAWTLDTNWEDEAFLGRLLELVEDELEARFRRPPEEVTAFAAAVLKDLVDNAPSL
jgi:hypothetical protein